jgi:hypothetical protein
MPTSAVCTPPGTDRKPRPASELPSELVRLRCGNGWNEIPYWGSQLCVIWAREEPPAWLVHQGEDYNRFTDEITLNYLTYKLEDDAYARNNRATSHEYQYRLTPPSISATYKVEIGAELLDLCSHNRLSEPISKLIS